jgi:hypothetical protein
MEFDERLHRAIQRGKRRHEANAAEAQAKSLSEEELKRLHSQIRLALSEHIEHCLKRVISHFPGFELETMYGERGWGAACSRDDLRLDAGRRRSNHYSRLEVTVRPFSSFHVVDLQAKGTVRNKEVFSRRRFEPIADVDANEFQELIDAWILEYAELYAAG